MTDKLIPTVDDVAALHARAAELLAERDALAAQHAGRQEQRAAELAAVIAQEEAAALAEERAWLMWTAVRPAFQPYPNDTKLVAELSRHEGEYVAAREELRAASQEALRVSGNHWRELEEEAASARERLEQFLRAQDARMAQEQLSASSRA